MHRSPFLYIATALVAAFISFDSYIVAQGTYEIIAESGMSAPGGGALGSGLLDGPSFPVLNNAGQVAFLTRVDDNNDMVVDHQAIMLANEGMLELVMKEGDQAPGLAGGTFGQVFDFRLNNNGVTAFRARTSENTDLRDIFTYVDGSAEPVARRGDPVPGGPFLDSSSFSLNNLDQLMFGGSFDTNGNGVVDPGNDGFGIYRYSGNTLTLEYEANGTFGPGGTLTSVGTPLINDAGQVLFAGTSGGVRRLFLENGGGLTVVSSVGDHVPGGGQNDAMDRYNDIHLNSQGQVGVFADIDTDSNPGVPFDEAGIFRISGDTTTDLAREGDAAPGGIGGEIITIESQFEFNDLGQALFRAGVDTHGLGGSSLEHGLFRSSGGFHQAMARVGDPAPDGNGVISSFTGSFPRSELNNQGTVAFAVDFVHTTGGTTDDNGLLITDGTETIQVARTGEFVTLECTTPPPMCTSVLVAQLSSEPFSDGFAMNDHGQVAYAESLTNGESRLRLFTPSLKWRRNGSGSWDQSQNWTLSLPPGTPHDVEISPSNSMTISGPTGQSTVNSLILGVGNGVATLLLAGGQLTVRETMQIGTNGIVTGDGVVDGAVLNSGTVLADNVRFEGRLTNSGLITGNGRLLGSIVNSTNGVVEAIGKDIEFSGGLTNDGGLIAGRNAVFRFGQSGLANNSTFAMSFGTTDVFGDVDNQRSGSVIVSGNSEMTFWNDVVNNGDFRVRGGSTAVFFGDFAGGEGITGTGTVFMEGDLQPGNSPAAIEFGGDLVFGAASTLQIEIDGRLPGVEYDTVEVSGTTSLAGALSIRPLSGHNDPSQRGSIQVFSFLAADQVTGAFEEIIYGGVTLSPLVDPDDPSLWRVHQGDGFFRMLNYSENSAEWVNYFAIPGDANGDFVVDDKDFEIWQVHNFRQGTNWTTGDFNGDQATDVKDFNIWLDNRDRIAMAVVPESLGKSLAIWILLVLLSQRKHRSR